MAVSAMVHAASSFHQGFQPACQATPSGGSCDPVLRRFALVAPPDCPSTSTSAPARGRVWCRSAAGDSAAGPGAAGKSKPAGAAGGGEKAFRDTRIHWGDSEEGWLGVDDDSATSSYSSRSSTASGSRRSEPGVSDALRELLAQATESHYRYLRISPSADLDEIKAAYRKLSKEYHPDSTALPLEIAAQKFMKLKEAYTVLSDEAERRYYDWKLAQTLVSREELAAERAWSQSGQGPSNQPRPKRYVEPVDALGPGENLPLSDQAQTALAFDIMVAIVSFIIIIYVSVFKDAT